MTPRTLTQTRNRIILGCTALAALAACSDDNSTNPIPTATFQETPLIADATGLGAPAVDPNLKNPWGIALNPTNGFVWVANNHSGTSTVYDAAGAVQALVVTIPSATATSGGAPTGIVYNGTTDFVIPGSGAATFLFAGEDGVISGWNATTGTNAVVVANRSANNAVYLGLAVIGNSLFAANFKGNNVDMFDKDFAFVKSFTDPNIPADYGPFNVQSIDGNLYVAYAKHDPSSDDELAGAGFGYVSVFGPDGSFVRRFASTGSLNAPWAITKAPASFGDFSGAILVGNFGDGVINAYNPTTGDLIGPLKNPSNAAIQLEGLWGLAVGLNNTLYFAAGIQDEEHGLFGMLGPHT